jgi:hypothetical protein
LQESGRADKAALIQSRSCLLVCSIFFFFGCFVAHGRIMSCRFGGISKDEPFLVRNPEVYVQHFFKNHVHMLFRDLHVELAYTAADGFFLSGTCIIIKS